MRDAGGVLMIIDPARALVEIDTFTCNHCNAITPLAPDDLGFNGRVVGQGTGRRPTADEMGTKCLGCMRWICQKCTAEQAITKQCVTHERKMDAMEKIQISQESRDRLFAALGL